MRLNLTHQHLRVTANGRTSGVQHKSLIAAMLTGGGGKNSKKQSQGPEDAGAEEEKRGGKVRLIKAATCFLTGGQPEI